MGVAELLGATLIGVLTAAELLEGAILVLEGVVLVLLGTPRLGGLDSEAPSEKVK